MAYFSERVGRRLILSIGAYISIRAPTTIVFRIDRWYKGLIRLHDFSKETENHLGQISKILLELNLIFEKRNFNVGVNPRPSEE
jgi:hypothetical protein